MFTAVRPGNGGNAFLRIVTGAWTCGLRARASGRTILVSVRIDGLRKKLRSTQYNGRDSRIKKKTVFERLSSLVPQLVHASQQEKAVIKSDSVRHTNNVRRKTRGGFPSEEERVTKAFHHFYQRTNENNIYGVGFQNVQRPQDRCSNIPRKSSSKFFNCIPIKVIRTPLKRERVTPPVGSYQCCYRFEGLQEKRWWSIFLYCLVLRFQNFWTRQIMSWSTK
jgi:hypothetical protein